jgi:hypothetical protein
VFKSSNEYARITLPINNNPNNKITQKTAKTAKTAMPPDSDNLVVQVLGRRPESPNWQRQNEHRIDHQTDHQTDEEMDKMDEMDKIDDGEEQSSEPTTPAHQNVFETPTFQPNKRPAQFSPEITQRERNHFKARS